MTLHANYRKLPNPTTYPNLTNRILYMPNTRSFHTTFFHYFVYLSCCSVEGRLRSFPLLLFIPSPRFTTLFLPFYSFKLYFPFDSLFTFIFFSF
jgi:hypothetical protein